MSKITIIFLAVCLFGISSAYIHGHSKSFAVESHHLHHPFAGHHVESGHSELLSVLAEGIFELFAKCIRAKVEVLLWLKKEIIGWIIEGLVHLKHSMIHEKDYMHGIIHTVAELLKVLVGGESHSSVGHVKDIISEGLHHLIPSHGYY